MKIEQIKSILAETMSYTSPEQQEKIIKFAQKNGVVAFLNSDLRGFIHRGKFDEIADRLEV